MKREWSGMTTCSLCLEESETVDHLFLNCYVASVLLGCFLPNKSFLRACALVDSLWNEFSGKWGAAGRKKSAILVAI